jgi:hypothetical protein
MLSADPPGTSGGRRRRPAPVGARPDCSETRPPALYVMTPERAYSALLRLYPSSFRREYGDSLRDTFHELVQEHRGSRAAFWLFIASDLGRSTLSLRLEAWRSGTGPFAFEWAGACACGAVVTALLANALTSAFAYLYHPYLEGVVLPPWSYGALLGAGLGVTQNVLLRRGRRLGVLWIAASAIGAGLGLEAAVAIAPAAGPLGYGAVLGLVVGVSHWAVLRVHIRRAAWVALGSTAALSLGMVSFATRMHTTFAGLNPLSPLSGDPLAMQPHAGDAAISFLLRGLYGPATPTDVAIEFAVMVTSGLVIAVLTTKPLSQLYAHPKET